MITSKLTTKAQTTIPQPVRAALRLKEGDELVYEIDGDRVILTKAGGVPAEDPFATFSEWIAKPTGRLMADFEQVSIPQNLSIICSDRRGS